VALRGYGSHTSEGKILQLMMNIGLCSWPEVTLNEIDNTKLKIILNKKSDGSKDLFKG
jgi:hypothetical protein